MLQYTRCYDTIHYNTLSQLTCGGSLHLNDALALLGGLPVVEGPHPHSDLDGGHLQASKCQGQRTSRTEGSYSLSFRSSIPLEGAQKQFANFSLTLSVFVILILEMLEAQL